MGFDKKKFNIIEDEKYGYKRLDPIPEDSELADYYEHQYFKLVRTGQRGSSMTRQMTEGPEADRERRWRHATTYSDICDAISKHTTGKRILDVGCGTGEFLGYAHEHGFDAVGVEPSKEAAQMARSQGLVIHQGVLEDLVSSGVEPFDAVIFLNVLEHVRNPAEMIKTAKKIIKPRGLICAMVPNDFSEMQLAAQDHLEKEPWWVVAPDHINYFDFKSIRSFMETLGFEIVYQQSDFPIEVFLLMDFDYIGNQEVGNKCHQRRVDFEMALPSALRRQAYSALSGAGIGRSCIVFGKAAEK